MKTGFKFFLFLVLALTLSSCRLYILKKRLEPQNKEFLSEVRYIISKQEKKEFLEMPKEKRNEFKKKFWKRRDPTPLTELNEFKEQYFERIKEANRRFTAGKPGWLTDRGKVYILLGSPVHKSVYPYGDSTLSYSQPTEIWYYNLFPVIFVDTSGTGDHTLHFINLDHQAEVYKGFLKAKKLPFKDEEEKENFDYSITLRKNNTGNQVVINITKQNLWMIEEQGNMVTTVQVELTLFNSDDQEIWEYMKKYPIKISDKEMEQSYSEPFELIVDLDIEILPGTYKIQSTIKNLTDNMEKSKTKYIKIGDLGR